MLGGHGWAGVRRLRPGLGCLVVAARFTAELPVVQRNQGDRAVAKGQANALGVELEITEHTIAREAAV